MVRYKTPPDNPVPPKKPKDPCRPGDGRPTTYNDEYAKRICETLATSTDSINKLCKDLDWMPHITTINLWRFKNEQFSSMYLKARQAQLDLVMENLDNMMDENLLKYRDSEGNERIDSPSATIAIAKANNRKWFASKIVPKLYGDKMQVESTENKETEALRAELKALREQLAEKSKSEY